MSRLLCKYGRRAFNSTSPQVKLVQLHNELHRKQELSLQLRSLKFQPELAEDAQEIFSIDTKFASADGASYPHPHPYAKALQKIREAAAVDEEMYPHPHPYASALQKIREYTELELEYEKSVREEVDKTTKADDVKPVKNGSVLAAAIDLNYRPLVSSFSTLTKCP